MLNLYVFVNFETGNVKMRRYSNTKTHQHQRVPTIATTLSAISAYRNRYI